MIVCCKRPILGVLRNHFALFPDLQRAFHPFSRLRSDPGSPLLGTTAFPGEPFYPSPKPKHVQLTPRNLCLSKPRNNPLSKEFLLIYIFLFFILLIYLFIFSHLCFSYHLAFFFFQSPLGITTLYRYLNIFYL